MTGRISPRTVVEAFLPPAGEASLRRIYDTANLVGIEDQPVRLAIRRMQASGELVQRGRGRTGAIELTTAGRERLERDRAAIEIATAQDAGKLHWDGSWSLFAIGAPERERAIRDALRRELVGLGAAALSTGVFVSPHDLRALLPPSAIGYVVSATATELVVRGTSDPARIVEMLWPAAPVDAAYDVIDEALAHDDTSALADVRRLLLADALERALRDDPLVPPELRSAPWRPSRLRRLWAQRWGEIGPAGAYADW